MHSRIQSRRGVIALLVTVVLMASAFAESAVQGPWRPTATTGAPAQRYFHSFVWTGSRMIIWGGLGYDGLFLNTYGDGGLYDPVSDAWAPVSQTGAPSARISQTTVWTGTKMIVWGGLANGVHLGTGGIYDPASNLWATMATAGAPTPRRYHTAVWTGTKMIVWGGYDGTSDVNSGAIYDPATNSWTSTTTVGAPSARRVQAAVWTGTKMLVWGGLSGSQFLDNGAAYDPSTNSWSPISTTGAPSARVSMSAVWTGNSMILWGGYDGQSIASGAIYDPATDQWRSTASTGAPSRRNGHTAVWTGSKMIVWGGQDDPAFFDTGAVYDPVTDSWSPISVNEAPDARVLHGGIWTGSEMIVWGGTSVGTGTGGILEFPYRAVITSPTPSSVLPGATTTFQWSADPDFAEFWLQIGSAANGADLYDASVGTDLARTINNLPIDGRPLYLKLWSRIGTTWKFLDYTFQAATAARATMLSPSPGSTLSGPTETFVWSTGVGVTEYRLAIGSTAATADLFDASTGTTTQQVVSGLPTDGRPLYVKLSSRIDSAWLSNDSFYMAVRSPALSINDVSVVEGSSGSTVATFTVKTAVASASSITVNYSTAGATATTGIDFAAASGTVTFASGEETKTISVLVTADTLEEGNETFLLNLSGATGAPIADAQGKATIFDDDRSPGAWKTITTVGAPSSRSGPTAIWAATKMIVWGGNTINGLDLNTGGAYDPLTDSWTTVTTAGAPATRRFYSAVGAGAKMIIWGGYFGTAVETGGIYDSASNTWAAIPIPGSPPRRYHHSAIWTGNQMIVWGGTDGATDLSTGGLFNPSTNAWTTVTNAGSPTGRRYHTSIWSGTKMIIWGGFAGGDPLNTGGVYDPANNTWTPTSTVGAPVARGLHRAAWTGTRMIVWGGDDGFSRVASGGIYDPATNSWAPMSADGGPSGAGAAVWADSGLVWWGNVARSPAWGGDRYSPSSNTWTPVTNAGAPSTLAEFNLVSTGSKVLLWGSNPESGTSAGGVYSPELDGTLKASLIAPAPNSTLSGPAVTFQWSAGANVDEYWLTLGSTPGGNDIFGATKGTSLSHAAAGLPTDGRTLYAILWSRSGGTWASTSYTFTTANLVPVKASMTSPTPGSTLTGASATFQWNTGTGMNEYWLVIRGAGGTEIFNATKGTNLSHTATGLPTDGQTLSVVLWSRVGSTWLSTNYAYTAANIPPAKAVMTSPAPGSNLSGSSATFTWDTGAGISEYWLDIGNSPGATDLFSGSKGMSLSHAASGLPIDGRTIYVQLWSRIGTSWLRNTYTYNAFDPRAAMTSPANGSLLAGASATFQWGSGTGVSECWLSVGGTLGGSEMYGATQGTNRSITLSSLPTDGRTLFVRLWSRTGSVWLSRDYSYQTAGTQAALTSPTPGSTFAGASATFTWTAGSGNSEYWLEIGSTVGGKDLFGASKGTSQTHTATGLPTDGRVIYVRLWSKLGTWLYRDFVFVAAR